MLQSSVQPSFTMTTPDTLAERAGAVIEQEILSGSLAPGSRLGIADLAARLGMGPTPVREGLSRLVSKGLVRAIGQRGFRVAEMSREDLDDIVALRRVVELEALRLSMRQGDDAWEAGIVATLHRLKRMTEAGVDRFREGVAEYDSVHRDFHGALIAACGSPRMIDLHRTLYDQTYRYRRVWFAEMDHPALMGEEHDELAALVIARDEVGATAKLAQHLISTRQAIYGEVGTSKANKEEGRDDEVSAHGGARRRARA